MMIPSANWLCSQRFSNLLLTNAPHTWSRNAVAIRRCGADSRVCFERMIGWEIFWRNHQQQVPRVKAIEFQSTMTDGSWRGVGRRWRHEGGASVLQDCYENDCGVPGADQVRFL